MLCKALNLGVSENNNFFSSKQSDSGVSKKVSILKVIHSAFFDSNNLFFKVKNDNFKLNIYALCFWENISRD